MLSLEGGVDKPSEHPWTTTTIVRMSQTSRVPDKPTLEGLEEEVGCRMEGAARPTPSTEPPSAPMSIFHRHASADGLRVAARRAHLQLPHTDLVARFQRMRGRRSSTRDRLGRQRPATGAGCRNYYGVSATRRCRYDAGIHPAAKPDPKKQIPISRQKTSSPVAASSPTSDEQAFEAIVAAGRPERRLVVPLHDISEGLPAYVAARLPAELRPRRGRTCPRSRRCGRSRSRPRVAQAEVQAPRVSGCLSRIAFHSAAARCGMARSTSRPPVRS